MFLSCRDRVRDAHAIRPPQLDPVEQFEAAPAEQVGHRHPHTLFGEHRVCLGFVPGTQRTRRRRSDPRLGQAAQAQQIRFETAYAWHHYARRSQATRRGHSRLEMS
jgi:hypothetical protein